MPIRTLKSIDHKSLVLALIELNEIHLSLEKCSSRAVPEILANEDQLRTCVTTAILRLLTN